MNAVFVCEKDFERYQMKKVVGLKKLKEYLQTEALEDKTIQKFIVEFSNTEAKKLVEALPSLNRVLDLQGSLWECKHSVLGQPIMFALAIKEYDIAQKLIDQVGELSIAHIGVLDSQRTFVGGPNSNLEVNDGILRIENLLYDPEFMKAGQLREDLLKRLEEEMDDGFEFSMLHMPSLKSKAMQTQFLKDHQQYPGIFERTGCLYAWDMESLQFLLRIYRGEAKIKHLLLNNNIGYYRMMGLQGDILERMKVDTKGLEEVVRILQNKKKLHFRLYQFVLRILSRIRNYETGSGSDKKDECMLLEGKIWEIISMLPFSEDDFLLLIDDGKTQEDYRKELVYELAHRKLGKKMPLFVSQDFQYDLSRFFGIEEETEECHPPFMSTLNQEDKDFARILRFMNDVGEIKYDNELLDDSKLLEKSIKEFLVNNAGKMKDIFVELLLCGLIPENCMEYVMKHVNANKKCTYMRPLLIAYKFGGLCDGQG